MRYTLTALLALASLAVPAHAQTLPDEVRAVVRRVETLRTVRYQQGRQEQTDRQTKTVKIGADGELTLANIAGDIAVTRTGGGEATIEIVKTSRARTVEEARELLALVTVSVTERAGRAEVRTQYPRDEDRRNNRRNMNVSVAYNVSAPANTRLTIGSVSGSIKVSDIKGDLSANSVSGAVRISNAGRIGAAKSISGDVEIVDTESDGAVEVQSISGAVLLRKVTARRVEVGSISGAVVVQDVQCDRIEAHSVSGNVEFAGALAKGGRYELNSHSGDVRIAIGGGTGFEVEANSFSGSVRSDLALTLQSNGERRPVRRTLRGVFGDGSAVIDITSFSGSVVITKR